MFGFARFFSTGADVFQEFFFGNRVIRLGIVCSDARRCTNELSDESTGYRVLWNCPGKIYDRLAEARRSLFEIINAFLVRLFANHWRRVAQPKSRFRIARAFGVRHSFVIRHSRIRHLKKKIDVSTALLTNIARSDCTTADVVACPTPSAPPSTCKPALHAIVMMIQANTTLLMMPEYRSQVFALSIARMMKPAVVISSAK